MPEVPKIVHDRLRAGLPGGAAPGAPHPDPDVLSAFAEQALSAAECEGVLQHLAQCGECREVVALSIPPVESGSGPVAREETEAAVSGVRNAGARAGGTHSWFAWPRLRWVALAAGVMVAAGVLLIHPGKHVPVPEAKQQPAVTVPRSEETIVAKQSESESDRAGKLTNLEKKEASAKHAFSRDQQLQYAYSARPRNEGIENGQIQTRASDDKDVAGGAATSAAMNAAPAVSQPTPKVPSAAETVEVTAASGPVNTEEARTDLPLQARQLADLPVKGRQVTDLTITKAKTAPSESTETSALQRSGSADAAQASTDTMVQRKSAAAGAAMNKLAAKASSAVNEGASPQPVQVSAQWAIHGNDLHRSLDSGASWTNVLHSDQPLLCYAARGNELWAGGKAGALFHSVNSGVSWSPVHPSAQEQTLSDDVTHIEIDSPSQIVLITSNTQSWSTTDGGKTWTKK